MKEMWKDIPGHPGYQASTTGNIRSMTRVVRCKGGVRTAQGKTLKAFMSTATGYLQVEISTARHSVHRLTALTWCDGYFAGAVVDHLNGNKQDNRAENLEWVTVSENCRRGYVVGGRTNPYQGVFSSAHPTSKAVISTDLRTGEERRYEAASDAARLGFDSGSISRCCHGKMQSHKGFAWRFADTETRQGGWMEAA